MKRKIDALTSLRIFAAAAIFALHAAQVQGFPTGNFAGFTLNHGVSFFYVLSGFILHYNYRDRIYKTNWFRFVAQRFARIWPLHVLTLLGATLLFLSDIVSWYNAYLSPGSLASIIFLVHAWSLNNNVYHAINGVSWSISVELFFYLCFLPLCAMALKRPFYMLFAVFLIQVAYIEGTWAVEELHQFRHALYTINPLFRLCEFVIGVVSAELWMRSKKSTAGITAMTFVEIASIAMVLGADILTNQVVQLIGTFSQSPSQSPYKSWAYVAWVDPFFAILICVFATGGGMITKALSNRIMLVLGEISFAIYLIHQPVQKFIGQKLQGLEPGLLLILAVIVTVLLSAAAHYWVEKPTYRFFSQRLQRKRALNSEPQPPKVAFNE